MIKPSNDNRVRSAKYWECEVHLEWNQQYETGIEEIDWQHRYFLSLIGRIECEMRATDDPVYRLKLLEELQRYAKFHFLSEENIMFKLGYPGLEQHRQHHMQLLDKLSNRALSRDTDNLLVFLVDWFQHHTANEDRQIGVFAGRVPA